MIKTCTWCKIEKSTECFYRRKHSTTGYFTRCIDCSKQLGKIRNKKYLEKKKLYNARYQKENRTSVNARSTRWRKANPDKALNARLKYKYDITLQEYHQILENQENKCKICALKFTCLTPYDKPYVDHSHETGRVRGLLCKTCNMGLGSFKDKVDNLKAAILYLEASSGY